MRKELRAWLRRLHDEVHVTTVFVTHDQEEAMEVAEQIVVLNHGDIEQVGTPRDLYEQAGQRVRDGFLGPVTELGGGLVRPHDVEILLEPTDGASEAQIDRIVAPRLRGAGGADAGRTASRPGPRPTRDARAEELELAEGADRAGCGLEVRAPRSAV